ncbi:hypothetical protein [Polyangium spumosum]|uniref:Squalene cyclase C-terminal domain-containing protein n=1 Tax=Polyangium spumosum TaxID=889282 RepID=A0A6N7PI93_9BACT|nr:hypothetical protein [Polyangium spumosum]MRG91698.1 hypothetical protein [Polyangium spumosum]
MNTLRPVWDGLPRAEVRRAQASLQTLGLEEDALRGAANLLGRLADARRPGAHEPIVRTFLLLAAAIHAAARLPAPLEPMPAEDEEAPFSPAAWLLLASRERGSLSIDPEAREAIDAVIVAVGDALDELGEAATIPASSPLATYGLSLLLPALVGRPDDPGLARAADALGCLVRLALEARAFSGVGASAPRPQLLGTIARGAGLGRELDLALAHAAKPAPDRLPLLRLVGDPKLSARLDATCAGWASEVHEALDGEDTRELVEATTTQTSRATRSARLFGFTPRGPTPEEELDRAIELARQGLAADPELRESWEFQRWGGPFDKAYVARLFPVGICLLPLAGVGEDISPRVEALVARRSVDGFRYFEGFAGIPPDADDLGLALQLLARSAGRAAAVEALAWPIEVLVRNTGEDGAMAVWLEQHLREPTPDGAPRWLGSRCVAVAANALIGLAEAGVVLPEGYFDRTLGWITRVWEAEGGRAVHFYPTPFARYLLARLADVAERLPGDPAPRVRLRALVSDIEQRIVSSQRADGSLGGGVMATACHLGVLACGRLEPFDPWPAVTFLVSRQDYDGLFPREPFYRTPGKDFAFAAHGARSITAALCLEAFVRTRARLARG